MKECLTCELRAAAIEAISALLPLMHLLGPEATATLDALAVVVRKTDKA